MKLDNRIKAREEDAPETPVAPVKYIWTQVDATTQRLKVPGGWLVRVISEESTTLTFFPDVGHAWHSWTYD